MTGSVDARERRGWLTGLAALLVEPADQDAMQVRDRLLRANPVVAVGGLAPRAGATTVARALGAALALRHDQGAVVVTADSIPSGGIPLATPAAARLSRAVGRAIPASGRAFGRLCLVESPSSGPELLAEVGRRLAPVVIDVGDPAGIAAAAAVADLAILVASPDGEPALAALVSLSLSELGTESVAVLNRDRGDSPHWSGQAALSLPEARVAARLSAGGREAYGPFGRAIGSLADRVSTGL